MTVKNAVSDPVYQSVLDFYRASIRDVRLLDAATPMPPLLSMELKAAAELVDQNPPGDTSQDEALRLAVTQFVERILFIDHSNYYRILGLNRDADTAQIKDHYKWLSRLLFSGGDVVHWNEANGDLLNRAYSVLRDPKTRKAYDEEFLSKSGIDNTTSVKREVAARTGRGRGSVAEAVSSVPGQAQLPAEGELSPAQAPAHPGRETAGTSSIKANVHRVKPTPSAGAGTARFPADLMSATSAVSSASKVPDGNAFPSPAKTVQDSRASRASLAVKMGLLIAVAWGVLVYLGDIPMPFIDDQVENRPLPISINIPTEKEAGQIIARSEPPLQGPVAGSNDSQDTALQPLDDTVSDLHDNTLEPAATTVDSDAPVLSAAPDKQAAPMVDAPLPDEVPVQQIAADAIKAPAKEAKPAPAPPATAPLSSRITKREGPVTPPRDTTKPAQAERRPKPIISSVPPDKPPAQHIATAATESPAKEIKPASAPPAAPPLPSRVTRQESAATAPQDKIEPVQSAPEPKPAASSVPLPPPVKSVGEQPPLSDDKLAIAATQIAPPLITGDSSSVDQSSPASPLQAVNEHHLESLVKTFITSYEAGDTDIFMSLLSEDAHTKTQRDRESIRIAYSQLFQATRNRRLKLRELEWKPSDNDTLIGRAPFLLTLIQEGQKKPLQFSGTIIFHVKNSESHLQITQFDYEYKGNK